MDVKNIKVLIDNIEKLTPNDVDRVIDFERLTQLDIKELLSKIKEEEANKCQEM